METYHDPLRVRAKHGGCAVTPLDACYDTGSAFYLKHDLHAWGPCPIYIGRRSLIIVFAIDVLDCIVRGWYCSSADTLNVEGETRASQVDTLGHRMVHDVAWVVFFYFRWMPLLLRSNGPRVHLPNVGKQSGWVEPTAVAGLPIVTVYHCFIHSNGPRVPIINHLLLPTRQVPDVVELLLWISPSKLLF